MEKRKLIIGLTGAMGSGKSTVAAMLRKKGAAVLDADKISHGCLKKQTPTYNKIKKAFGKEILAENGEINKKKLAEVVFSDKKSLRKLCGIIHPAVIKGIEQKAKKLANKVVVIDAPLLIEAGLTSQVDTLVVVAAKKDTCVKRSTRRLKITKQEARRRLAEQMPLSEKVKYADFVIKNDGGLNITSKQVQNLWKQVKGDN